MSPYRTTKRSPLSLVEGDPLRWVPDIDASVVPNPLPSGIELGLRSGVVGMRADGVVGSFRLLDGTQVDIAPKVGSANFLHMLSVAEGLEQILHDMPPVEYGIHSETAPVALYARPLFTYSDRILRASPRFGRTREIRTSTEIQGRLDVRATAQRIFERRDDPMVSHYRERNWDQPENRVISEALHRAYEYLPPQEQGLGESVLRRWKRVSGRSSDLSKDVRRTQELASRRAFGRSRSYYEPVINLALAVLGLQGVGATASSKVEAESLLMDSALVYERYLRRVIADHYSRFGYLVRDGRGSGTFLYTDHSRELAPDILASKGGRVALLADAKYKEPSSDDHYQMACYLERFGIDTGILLCPARGEGSSETDATHRQYNQRVTRVVRLPLTDLARCEEILTSLL